MTDSSGAGPLAGPCVAWIDGQDVADFLNGVGSSDSGLFDTAAVAASQLLFEMSGRQYPGLCEQTVRPCVQPCGAWATLAGYPSQWWGFGWNGLDWGPGGAGWGWWGQDGSSLCGCRPLSQIKLAGYPVDAITQVKIDGSVLDPLDENGNPNYRLDEWQLLTRMADPGPPLQPRFWPGCQNLDLDDTHPGTFSVIYTSGVAPPLPGVLAAQELGCEIYKFLSDGDCRLPSGATALARQGVNITRGLLVTWGLQQHARGGQNPRTYATGLPLVDAFLSAYNPTGRRSRPRVFSPDLQQYARQLGT